MNLIKPGIGFKNRCSTFEKNRPRLQVKCQFPTQFLTLHSGVLSYEDTGEPVKLYCLMKYRPVILCIPSAGENRLSFRHWVPWLIEAKYRVVTMDLRGTGNSSPNWSSCSSLDIVQDINSLIFNLNLSAQRKVVIIAHSESCVAAILLAATSPFWLEALMLISPSLDIVFNKETALSGDQNESLNLSSKQAANFCKTLRSRIYNQIYPERRALKLKRTRYGSSSAPKDIEEYLVVLKQQWKENSRFRTCHKLVKAINSKKEKQYVANAVQNVRCPIFLVCGESNKRMHQRVLAHLKALSGCFINSKVCQTHILTQCGSVPHEEGPVHLLAILDKLCGQSSTFWNAEKQQPKENRCHY